jgi:hypothetical protein
MHGGRDMKNKTECCALNASKYHQDYCAAKGNKTGCWKCRYLAWVTDDLGDDPDGGYWWCPLEDVYNFKIFPCKKLLPCFESMNGAKNNMEK